MSKTDNLNADYIRRILKTLDDDLAILVVASCVSLDPNVLLKILVVTADVSYYRNMVKDMEKSLNNSTFSWVMLFMVFR